MQSARQWARPPAVVSGRSGAAATRDGSREQGRAPAWPAGAGGPSTVHGRSVLFVSVVQLDDSLPHEVELNCERADELLVIEALRLTEGPRGAALSVKTLHQDDALKRGPAWKQRRYTEPITKYLSDGFCLAVVLAHGRHLASELANVVCPALVAAKCNVDLTHPRESALTESDWQRIGRSPIAGWTLDIIGDASTMIATVRAEARRMGASSI